jgi:hypothetical protein
MQPRIESLIESLANIAVGYLVAVGSQMLVFPMFGIDVPTRTNFLIGLWFTGISLVRSYALRRVFNWRLQRRVEASRDRFALFEE